jgi:hypothetical protein
MVLACNTLFAHCKKGTVAAATIVRSFIFYKYHHGNEVKEYEMG